MHNSARDLFDAYKTAINHHDFDLLEPLISSECQFWFSSGTYQGLTQTRHAFEKTWRTIQQEVYTVTDMQWVAETNTAAVCTYTFHWAGIVNGAQREGKGRGTSCFRQEASGWKIIHEHLSPFPA